ncbi:MAG: hypothetical protein IJK48_03500 [Bacteroidales bacterium]|nr:hypothetical protein [Bacteroidales bacterium]
MKNTRLALILSLVSLVGVLSIWMLWIFGCFKVSVIDLGTFVGVIVTLLAIIVTIVIGWQIINAVEIREKISSLEQRQNVILDNERLLAENSRTYIKLANNLQSGILSSSADLYQAKGQLVEAFLCLHSAFHQAILAGQPGLDGRINQLKLICELIANPPIVNFLVLKKQLDAESQLIRNTEEYKKYLSVQYEQVMTLFWQKMRNMGLV